VSNFDHHFGGKNLTLSPWTGCESERTMSILVIRCPQTGQDVPTGIEIDSQSLQKVPDIIAYTRCPHCGIEHAWWPDEAWLTDSLPRIAA
jgi:hypothetical protein